MSTPGFKNFIIGFNEVPDFLRGSELSFLKFSTIANENKLWDVLHNTKLVTYRSYRIKDWNLYEAGEKELTQKDFFNYLLINIPEQQLAILFTDEGFLNECAYKFYISEFWTFSSLYEEDYRMEFFQLSFYLVLFPDINICRYIDEAGSVNEFTFK